MDRLALMRTNPRAGWAIRDVEAICAEFGVSCAPPRGGGSHFKVSHPRMREILTIPARRPIKPIYVKKLIAFIDAVRQ